MTSVGAAAGRLLRIGWKLAIVAAVAGFVIYRMRFAPLPVDGFPAVIGPVVAEVLGTGTLEARVQATISAKISGRVVRVYADQGDRVARDQLLVALDDGDLSQQVEIAKADLAATRAGVDRAAAEIARAQATATHARDSYGRTAQLAAQGRVSDDEVGKATQQRDVAEADLSRAQLAKVEVERQVLKAEEGLRYYQERLTDTKITSPFDALVIRRTREPGDIVVPGTPILQVISTDQMWVSAWVDESALPSLAVGQPARVVFRSEPGTPYAGAVTRLAPLADRETREFVVDVTVKDLPKSWAVGQRAEVYIRTAAREEALVVPQRAIVWDKGRPGLFVSDAGRAAWRNVTLGLRGSEVVEVTAGLSPGEVVIWRRDPGNAPLAAGRAVEVVKVP